jgi:hypothetical protein
MKLTVMPAEAGDVGAALGDRPGSSRMAKACPRWKREVPRRLPPCRGVEGLPARMRPDLGIGAALPPLGGKVRVAAARELGTRAPPGRQCRDGW